MLKKLPKFAMPKKIKILVTGGAGFIGSHTADALRAKGYAVRILDNLEPPVHTGKWPKYVLGKGFELMKGDVRKKETWEKALQGVGVVYHLAAYQDQRPDFSKFSFGAKNSSLAMSAVPPTRSDTRSIKPRNVRTSEFCVAITFLF